PPLRRDPWFARLRYPAGPGPPRDPVGADHDRSLTGPGSRPGGRLCEAAPRVRTGDQTALTASSAPARPRWPEPPGRRASGALGEGERPTRVVHQQGLDRPVVDPSEAELWDHAHEQVAVAMAAPPGEAVLVRDVLGHQDLVAMPALD